MENPSTSTVYMNVIEDVINKCRGEFVSNGGPGEAILYELQIKWEKKILTADVIEGPIDRSAARLMRPRDRENIIGDLNVPYEGPETPEADSLIPEDFLQSSSGKRKRDDLPSPHRSSGHIPQQDAAGDVLAADESEAGQGSNPQLDTITIDVKLESSSKIPQVEGTFDDNTYTGAVNEDFGVANTSAPLEVEAPTPAPVDPDDDDEDEPLNENDDDDDDLIGVDEDETDERDLILTMFDKVTRAKSTWRCSLRNGIARVDNRDILFKKALGEFDFMKSV